jgi:hypothetical protein
MSDVPLFQRYEFAASLCEGLRVLDLSATPDDVRGALASSASELVVAGAAEAPEGAFDVVLALGGLAMERRESLLSEVHKRAGEGARVLVAFERQDGQPQSPRVDAPPQDAARALAERLPSAVVLRQFLAEGSVIASPEGNGAAPELDLQAGDTRDEDAAALIVVSGFDEDAVSRARASLRFTATPVLLSYVRGLEAAHAELLRANRELMRERVGREGSAAASLLNAQSQLEEMRAIAKEHEAHIHRVRAWYDAPRYHLVDRIRDAVIKVPGFTAFVRTLWSLVSTRAETPQLDAAANPDLDDDKKEAAEVTRAREGLDSDDDEHEPQETSARLEEAP